MRAIPRLHTPSLILLRQGGGETRSDEWLKVVTGGFIGSLRAREESSPYEFLPKSHVLHEMQPVQAGPGSPGEACRYLSVRRRTASTGQLGCQERVRTMSLLRWLLLHGQSVTFTLLEVGFLCS